MTTIFVDGKLTSGKKIKVKQHLPWIKTRGIDSEDVALLECQDCGSFFEPGTYCPVLFE
jgi:hypothetical protein